MKLHKLITILTLFPAALFAGTAFSNSIFDFQTNIIDFSDDGIQENIRSGILITPTPADLSVGDIFIDVDGCAQKVASIQKNGQDIFIETIQPQLREVYLFVDIPEQDLELQYDIVGNVESRELGEGVLNDYLPNPDKKSFKDISLGDVSVTLESRYKKNESKVTASLKLPYTTLNKHSTWKFWEWTLDYIKGHAKLGYKCDLEVGAGLAVKDLPIKKEWEIMLFEGMLTDGVSASGVAAGLYFWPSFSGNITTDTQAYTRIVIDAGGQCSLDGLGILCVPHNFNTWGGNPISLAGFSTRTEVSGNIKAKFGPKLKFVLVGISVASLNAGMGPYIAGRAAFSSYLLYDITGKATRSDFEFESGEIEVGVTASIGLGLIKDIYTTTLWERDFPLYKKKF